MYTQFYNLREEPFRLTPDPRFLHLAEPHRIALGVMLQSILTRKGFIALTGPIGTGKTTLIHAALHLLAENAAVKDKLSTAFIVNPTLTREEFLEAVLDEFEITCASTSKPRRLAALHDVLLATQRKGGTTILIVDEAHLLTNELLEEIRLLSNTDSYQEKLLQVILAGQPELQTKLYHPSMKALLQRIAANCNLRPLSLPETRVYVMERLHAAGLREESPFSPTVLEKVFEFTTGVPRLINLLCDGSLSIGFNQKKLQIDAPIVEEAAGKLNLLAEQAEVQAQTRAAEIAAGGRGDMLPASTEGDIRTAVDLLISAMKQNRVLARE